MAREYTVQAPCYSWKCQGQVRTFTRDVQQALIDRVGPSLASPLSGPSERAYCTVCGTYAHIPLKGDELVRGNKTLPVNLIVRKGASPLLGRLAGDPVGE